MTGLEPARVPAGVSHEITVPALGTDRGEAYRRVLVSWLAANALDAEHLVNRTVKTESFGSGHYAVIRCWRRSDVDVPPPAGSRVLTSEAPNRNRPGWHLLEVPMAVEPAGVLVGDPVCGHVHITDGGTTALVCNVLVDDDYRHAGAHSDGLAGCPEWPNDFPGPPLPPEGNTP